MVASLLLAGLSISLKVELLNPCGFYMAKWIVMNIFILGELG